MANELMTTAVCWDMDANTSASFAHSARDLFYFCPCCLNEVAASISTIGNYFFFALNSHKPGCDNEKEKSHASAVPGLSRPKPAALPALHVPSHLGKLATRRKRSKPSVDEMEALIERVTAAPAVIHLGTLAEVVDAWSSMSVSDRHQTPLTIAGQPLNYSDAFAQLSPTQKDPALLGCDRLVTHAKATVRVLSHVILVVTWLKFTTQNKPVPIRAKVKLTDPAAGHLTEGQHVTLFLHGPVPTLNAAQTYFEMQHATEYLGAVVRP